MANKLILDKSTLSDPDVLADCKVGDTKQLTVTAVVTRDEGDVFEADVTDIEYSGENENPGYDASGETGEGVPAETPPASKNTNSSY